MKKAVLHILLWMISCQLFSQNWVQVGDLNDTPRVMLNDSVSGLLYLSGNFRFNGIDTVDGFCAYNGSSFTSFGRRFDCNSFGCEPAFMIARYQSHLYLSGPGLTIIDNVDVNGIGEWDGVKWSAALTGLYYKDDHDPVLDDYAIHEDVFYGVGAFRTAEGDTCNSVAYWNGQHWTGLNFPPRSGNFLPRVFRVIFYKDQLYVGGNFYWEVGEGADIARLSITGWEMVGGGLKGGLANVYDMAVYKGELYICGYFRELDGNVGNKIMRWDGQQWKKVGEGFCSPDVSVTKMMVFNDKLYVVGLFDCVDNDLPAHNIATWDGERWCSFGNSYFNNKISYIAEYKGEIYVSGGFTEVDGQPCRSLAKWVGNHITDTCSAPVSAALEISGNRGEFRLWPNPVGEELHIESAGPIERLQIFDSTGKMVTNINNTISGTKEESFTIDTRLLTSGLYYVTFQSSGRTHSGKFVKI